MLTLSLLNIVRTAVVTQLSWNYESDQKQQDDSHEITPGAWTIGRVAVLNEARGTGLGRRIVAEAIEWIREHTEAERIGISAQQYLEHSLYGKAGFVTEGEAYQEAGIEHVHMNLVLRESR